jgi:hypothetical protein
MPELPKLSAFTQLLAMPESYFEGAVRDALKVEIPPGPQSTLLKVQQSVEAGRAPELEEVLPRVSKLEEALSRLPRLPPLEELAPKAEAAKAVAEQEGSVEAPKRPSTAYRGFVSEVV